MLSDIAPVVVTLAGVSATLVGLTFGYFIKQLLEHARIIAVVTNEVKQIPGLDSKIYAVADQVVDVRLEQERVKTELAVFKAGHIASSGSAPTQVLP